MVFNQVHMANVIILEYLKWLQEVIVLLECLIK